MNKVKHMNTMKMREFVVMDLKNKKNYLNNKKFCSCNNKFYNRKKCLTNSNSKFVKNYNKNFQKRNNYWQYFVLFNYIVSCNNLFFMK